MSDLNTEELLPQGRTEFDKWAAEVIAASGLPDNDSMRWALAVSITHLPPHKPKACKQDFIDILQKGAATQVAFAVMDELKIKQKAASDAAFQTNAVEATTSSATNVAK